MTACVSRLWHFVRFGIVVKEQGLFLIFFQVCIPKFSSFADHELLAVLLYFRCWIALALQHNITKSTHPVVQNYLLKKTVCLFKVLSFPLEYTSY